VIARGIGVEDGGQAGVRASPLRPQKMGKNILLAIIMYNSGILGAKIM